MKLVVENLSKHFSGKPVITNVSFSLAKGESIAILGKNGSGKSTLVKLLSGLLSPSSGSVAFELNGHPINKTELFRVISVSSPHLFFYEELSALENLNLKAKNAKDTLKSIDILFEAFELSHYKHSPISEFSSGMLQRLRLIQALAFKSPFLFLDEPTLALDEKGKDTAWKEILNTAQEAVLVVATNEPSESSLFKRNLNLDELVV